MPAAKKRAMILSRDDDALLSSACYLLSSATMFLQIYDAGFANKWNHGLKRKIEVKSVRKSLKKRAARHFFS